MLWAEDLPSAARRRACTSSRSRARSRARPAPAAAAAPRPARTRRAPNPDVAIWTAARRGRAADAASGPLGAAAKRMLYFFKGADASRRARSCPVRARSNCEPTRPGGEPPPPAWRAIMTRGRLTGSFFLPPPLPRAAASSPQAHRPWSSCSCKVFQSASLSSSTDVRLRAARDHAGVSRLPAHGLWRLAALVATRRSLRERRAASRRPRRRARREADPTLNAARIAAACRREVRAGGLPGRRAQLR